MTEPMPYFWYDIGQVLVNYFLIGEIVLNSENGLLPINSPMCKMSSNEE